MKRRLLAFLTLLAAFAALPVLGGGRDATFRVGLFPNLSPLTLIATQQPLARHLENTLGRPVELMTAPDFRTFIDRCNHGAYDAILAAPHLARFIEQAGRYQPVVTYEHKLRAYLVVAANSPRLRLSDLGGARIAEPDELALVGMLGRQMIAAAGLQADSVTWINSHSQNGGALAVTTGRADAAVLGTSPYAQLTPAIRGNLRILATSQSLPNQVWLINKDLGQSDYMIFKTSLLSFPGTPAGQRYIKINDFGGIRPLQDDELRPLDPFASLVRKRLEQSP